MSEIIVTNYFFVLMNGEKG